MLNRPFSHRKGSHHVFRNRQRFWWKLIYYEGKRTASRPDNTLLCWRKKLHYSYRVQWLWWILWQLDRIFSDWRIHSLQLLVRLPRAWSRTIGTWLAMVRNTYVVAPFEQRKWLGLQTPFFSGDYDELVVAERGRTVRLWRISYYYVVVT